MKKAKKVLSLLLSISIVFGVITSSLLAFAGDNYTQNAEQVETDTSYFYYPTDGIKYPTSNWYYKSFIIDSPVKGSIDIKLSSENETYFQRGGGSTYYELYDLSNLDNRIWISYTRDYDYGFDINEKLFYSNITCSLNKGTYLLVYKYCYHNDNLWGGYNISFSFKADVTKPSAFKVSTRNVNSLKLSWSKVGNVSGYQLQRKVGDTYKTVANTTATSYTVKDLASATNYSFRVRAYKTVDGKKYYSSWKALTTPTKPATVSIKTPTTNSKHQIIAKWNKVTRASGYQVQYCKNKSCSSVIATKTVSGQSKVSYIGKNFTKNKTYYVRVRAYKTVNNTKYYGAWSSVKSIKCK